MPGDNWPSGPFEIRLAVQGDEEMDLFTDYAIYAYHPNGFNMAEKYRRLFSKDADEFELALLAKMSSARYAIYQVEQTNSQDQFHAVDVFSKARYPIMDFQMAKSVRTGMILAGYLIEFDDFTIQTGGTVLVTRDILQADEVVNIIDMIDDDQLATFLNIPSNGSKLARAVVSATIRLGQAKNVPHTVVWARHERQLPTHTGLSRFSRPAVQLNAGSADCRTTKPALVASTNRPLPTVENSREIFDILVQRTTYFRQTKLKRFQLDRGCNNFCVNGH